MKKLTSILPVIYLFVFILTLQARIIHVPGDSATIQGAIDGAAMFGDTVMIAPGRYYERNINFNQKRVTVMSSNPDDSAVVASTIVDADEVGTVFYFHSGETERSVLTGLTITGTTDFWFAGIHCELNSSPTISKNIITNNTGFVAGGIYCSYSSPIIVNNIITGNHSNGPGAGSSPLISHNTISGNIANFGGGGIYIMYCDPKIRYNTITGNVADLGAGIHVETASPEITGNVIAGNIAVSFGGGINVYYNTSLTMANNIIEGNTAQNGRGGGVMCFSSNPTLINNIISGNTALQGEGGGLYGYNTSLSISNCTFVGNAAEQGGGLYFIQSLPVVTNTILWDDTALTGPELYLGDSNNPSTLTIRYSDVKGGEAAAHPLFGMDLWG